MQRIIAFSVRPDEQLVFDKYKAEHPEVEITTHRDPLTIENVDLVAGYHGVSMLGSPLGRDILEKIAANQIKYIASRSIGYDNIDLEAAKELGIHVSNVSYSPGSVAEYTLMLILMTIRKAKLIIRRGDIQDFSLMGSDGRELRNTTVGVIGTGRIGARLIQYLSGFGCKIIASDPYPNASIQDICEYVSLDEIVSRADVISLNSLLTEDNYHLLDQAAFDKMKPGVVIVNCSRGELIDSAALIKALESGKVGGAALDVVEGDQPIFHHDHRLRPIINTNLAILRSFPNVTVTPHVAFYTLDVVSEMVNTALDSMQEFWKDGTAKHQLV